MKLLVSGFAYLRRLDNMQKSVLQ